LEIFFVNEKVCFEKQNFQYSRYARFRLFALLTTIYCRNNNNRFSVFLLVAFLHRFVSRINNAILAVLLSNYLNIA